MTGNHTHNSNYGMSKLAKTENGFKPEQREPAESTREQANADQLPELFMREPVWLRRFLRLGNKGLTYFL